jgi:hypothetical protein
MDRVQLTGSYNHKSIDAYIWKSHKPVSVVTIFVQGLYGVYSPGEQEDKVNMLVSMLTSKGISHCVNYNSSRDFSFNTDTDYDERKKAFIDKTFIQELDDLKSVVKWIVENSEKIFGIKKSDLILNVHGNSLGGTFTVLLDDFFPVIKKISLCGSGCGTNGSTKPILSTYLPEQTILDSISKFRGELLLLQGSEDTQVPLESGMKILAHAIHAKTSHMVVEGANHNFSKMCGEKSDLAKGKYITILFDFLSTK